MVVNENKKKSQNRLIYCEVTDRASRTFDQTVYAYDAFGRRVLVKDKGEAALRTLYDGFGFDVIKTGPVFENGMFTDSQNTGIRWSNNGRPTGSRYRYLDDTDVKDSDRYFYLDENTYTTVNSRYRGERTELFVNGTLTAQTTYDYGTGYFSTDFGYLGKQHDPTAALYNYGYRDYKPQTSRFTTLDPIRDGTNWFSYCNGDPVNFVDLLGLCPVSDKENEYNPYKYELSSKYFTNIFKQFYGQDADYVLDKLRMRPTEPYTQIAEILSFIPNIGSSGCYFMGFEKRHMGLKHLRNQIPCSVAVAAFAAFAACEASVAAVAVVASCMGYTEAV